MAPRLKNLNVLWLQERNPDLLSFSLKSPDKRIPSRFPNRAPKEREKCPYLDPFCFSVLESQRLKYHSFIYCRISTNYEQPRQSVLESQRIKRLLKEQSGFYSLCIFLERDLCLRRATKIVATEVAQARQTITVAKLFINCYLKNVRNYCKTGNIYWGAFVIPLLWWESNSKSHASYCHLWFLSYSTIFFHIT